MYKCMNRFPVYILMSVCTYLHGPIILLVHVYLYMYLYLVKETGVRMYVRMYILLHSSLH